MPNLFRDSFSKNWLQLETNNLDFFRAKERVTKRTLLTLIILRFTFYFDRLWIEDWGSLIVCESSSHNQCGDQMQSLPDCMHHLVDLFSFFIYLSIYLFQLHYIICNYNGLIPYACVFVCVQLEEMSFFLRHVTVCVCVCVCDPKMKKRIYALFQSWLLYKI